MVHYFAGFEGGGGGPTPGGFKVWKLEEKKYFGQFSPYGKSLNFLNNLFIFILEFLEFFRIVPTTPEDPIIDYY